MTISTGAFYSFIYSTRSLILSFLFSLVSSFVQSLAHSFIHSFIHSFVRLFIYKLLVHSLSRSLSFRSVWEGQYTIEREERARECWATVPSAYSSMSKVETFELRISRDRERMRGCSWIDSIVIPFKLPLSSIYIEHASFEHRALLAS